MCCQNDCSVSLVPHQQIPDTSPGVRINPGSWFIKNNHLGATNKSTGNAQLPLHTTRQVLTPLVSLVRDAEVSDHLLILLHHLTPGHLVLTLQLGVEPEVL